MLAYGCIGFVIGDQLAIAKETGRRLGMGSNMYPSASLLGNHKDANLAAIPVEELIEKADGFAGVFPGWCTSLLSLSYMSLLCFMFVFESGRAQV